MNGTQTFILECSRINSVGVSGGGPDFNNKSSWTNQTAPILLKQGDSVQLQNVLINVGGADTNAIQFQGVGTAPQSSIQDNFTLLKIGFYMNHNGIYTSALPLKYTNRSGSSTERTLTQDTTQSGDYDGITNRTNNSLGKFENYQYFVGLNSGEQITDDTQRISRIDKIESINPFNPMNGGKFAVIHPSYSGWARSNDGNGNAEDQIHDIMLLEQDIPILLPKGFVSPTGIADLMTNTLSYTNPEVRNPNDIMTAEANKYKQDETAHDDKVPLKQYSLNGYTYKTIKCNLQGQNHKIYGCLGVDDPNLWLYGTLILSNSATDNMTTQKHYFNQDNHPDDARVDYPVIVWERFVGNDPTDFDIGIEGRDGQYSNYSPFRSDLNTDGDDEIMEVFGLGSTFSGFNDVYRNQATNDTDGFYLAQASSNSYRLVKNSVIGTGLDKTAIFVDNDSDTETKLIAWRRFATISGNWTADEHQIFKTTDLGEPNVGNSNPYQFSGAGAGQPSEAFFSYSNDSNRTIFMGAEDGGLGFSSYVFIKNLLTDDSGGIIEGGEYIISFSLEIQAGYSYSNTNIQVVGNGIGLSSTIFNTDGDKEVSFTATGSNLTSNAVEFGVFYSNIGAIVKVSNISIKRENLNQDDEYAVSNVWYNFTANPENNKIYSITKNTGLSNLECVITNNTRPPQGIYTGVDFNRTYKVITRGLVLIYSNGNFVASSILNGHDPNVALLYNDDDPDFTYWLYQPYANVGQWVAYRLTKYQGGIPENGTIIGDFASNGAIMKHPNRAGQQYYNFHLGNSWTFSSNFIDFTLGNTWNTRADGSGFALTATQHIAQGLSIDRTIFSFQDGGNYTGGTGGHTFSFTGATGMIGSFVYDNVLEDNDNAGTIVSYYIQADFMDGLQGHFTTGSVSGDWNFSTSGGSSSNGRFSMVGGATFTLDPVNPVSSTISQFDYDYKFDGVADFYMKTTTTGPDAFDVGTYFRTTNNDTRMDLNFNGSWSYDNTTGQIQFTEADGSVHQTLHIGATGTNPGTTTISSTTNFTNHIADPLPVIDTDKQYFASVIVNGITYYLGANSNGAGNDTDKEGKRGRLIFSTDGNVSFQTATWDWNGSNLIDMDGDGGNIPLTTSTSGLITLSNVFEYPTEQNFVVNANTYAVPIDGRQYGSGFGDFGTTNTSQASSAAQYLGFNTSSQAQNVEDITEGFVYDTFDADFASNNGKKWKISNFGEKIQLTISDANDGITLITLENPDGGEGYLGKGWSLLRVDKKLDSEISGSGSDGITFTNASPVGFLSLLKEDLNDGQKGVRTNGSAGLDYQIFTNNNFAAPTTSGTFKNWSGSVDTDKAHLEKHQLLMTNIKLTENNLEKVKNLFRNTETYNGNEFTRADIAKDTRNFFTTCDLGRSKENSYDFTNTNSSENQTGREPWVANYMRDQGIMGKDDGDEDTKNMGCVCPVRHNSGNDENRLEVFTAWLDGYENRIKADGLFGNETGNNTNFCYGNSISTKTFQTQYPDLYNKCRTENIGIIPFVNKESGDLMIGFELYKDYDGNIFKIQNLTWFGFSPSVIDHKYVTFFNNDAPSIKDNDFNFTADIRDQMNFIQVGATQPTIEYNNDLNKFTLRYFHTPTFFNKETGSDTNIGQEIAKFFDNASNVIFRDFCFKKSPEELADDNRRNIGVNDSQCGIFIKDVFFQKRQINNQQITSSSDSLAVEMTPTNFYNTLWFKLGFSYYDLKPIKFKFDAFYSNRFNNITYNNTSTQFRETGLVPFTTNALININDAPIINVFSQNSGVEATENTNKGTPIYGLGFNNNLPVSFQVESDSLFPASIPVNIGSGYYRIYTDLPIDTLTYTAGGSNLAVIGSALLNYASSQQFFFSYGMDYGATITKDVLINNVKIEIRDDRGSLIEGLGDRSMVVIKIVRNIQLTEPPPDPQVEELKDIEKDIEELVDEVREGNIREGIDEAESNLVQAGISVQDRDQLESKEREGDTPEEIRQFVDNFNIQMIQNLINRTLIRVSDNEKDIARRIASGLANFFLRRDNVKDFNKIVDDLYSKGIEDTLKQPYVRKFVEGMNKFYINVDGRPIKGARDQPEIAEITDEGALYLYDKIAQLISTNRKIKVGELTAGILEQVGNMILNTNDIRIYDEDDPDIVEAQVEKDDDLSIADLDIIEKRRTRGIKPDVRVQMKKNFVDYENLDTYLRLYARFDDASLEDLKNSSDYDTLKLLYKDAGKFTLQDDPVGLSKTITRMNNIMEDILGTTNYDNYAINLERFETIQSLTGTGVSKPQKRLRRTKKETREAEAMEEEDPRNIEREERRRALAEAKEKRGERRETRMMREEDRPEPDFRTKIAKQRMKEEGIEESPLRTKGRAIMKEKAERSKEGGASK